MATKQAKYPIEVFWSDEDEGYIAIVPDLPGCSAWGASEADAITEAHDAITAWLKAAKAAGHVIPAPTPPLDDAGFSGKFLMRLPRRLHADLARKAKREGVSLNQYVLYLLSERNSQRLHREGSVTN
jgi:predicted RNase H-like HicB family nuclease